MTDDTIDYGQPDVPEVRPTLSIQIAEDQAEAWFEEWAEIMDVDTESQAWDKEDRDDFAELKRVVVKGIMRGHVTFSDDMLIEYTPWRPDSRVKEKLVFHERSGASMMSADSKRTKGNTHRMYGILADMCRVPVTVFSGLVGADIKMCEAIFALLMA